MTLDLGSLQGPTWRAEGVTVALRLREGDGAELSATVRRLTLPPPIGVIRNTRITCPRARLSDTVIACPQGTLALHTPRLGQRQAGLRFRYRTTDKKLELHVSALALAGGQVDASGEYDRGAWTVRIATRQVDGARLAELLASVPGWPAGSSLDGKLDLHATLSGDAARGQATLRSAQIKGSVSKLAFSSADGRNAGEDIDADIDARVERRGRSWQATGRVTTRGGTVCIGPCWTLPDTDTTARLEARFDPTSGSLDLHPIQLTQGQALQATANVRLRLDGQPRLVAAQLELAPSRLKAVYGTWLQPLLIGTPIDSLDTAGRISGNVDYRAGGVQQVNLFVDDVYLDDRAQRFGIYGASGRIHWSGGDSLRESHLRWRGGHLYRVRLGAADLAFESRGGDLRLARPASVAILDGGLQIDHFSLEGVGTPALRSSFDAVLTPVSMEALTHALGWPIMSGKLSGVIPSVTYKGGELQVGGVLLVRAFDGSITVRGLRLEQLFGAVPQLYADVDLRGLDLTSLTRTFSFGNIQGRLDGHVRGLHLVNWKPVAFAARLATPSNDDSRHRISQKAVDNLTNLGGGGITGALSRSLLGIFKEFSYDRLGISCRLHDGICDMDGVAPAPHGYYIVKGGGLPRIDIIGYAHEVDWNELLARLASVTAHEGPVVK